MILADFIMPYITGQKDIKKYGDSEEKLLQQVETYKKKLESLYKKKEYALIRRNLSRLERKVALLDIDHINFNNAVEFRKREINTMTGVSPDDKESLLMKTEDATQYIIERNGLEIELNLEDIIKKKQYFCILANKRIASQNDKFQRLCNAFEYRLSVYLRSINKGKLHNQIKFQLEIKPQKMKIWEYSNTPSIPKDNAE